MHRECLAWLSPPQLQIFSLYSYGLEALRPLKLTRVVSVLTSIPSRRRAIKRFASFLKLFLSRKPLTYMTIDYPLPNHYDGRSARCVATINSREG